MIYIEDKIDGFDVRIYDDGKIELKFSNLWKFAGHLRNYPDKKTMNLIFTKPWNVKFNNWGGSWGINKNLLMYLNKYLEHTTINVYIDCPDSKENGKEPESILYHLPLKDVINKGISYKVDGWDKQLYTPIMLWNKVEDYEYEDYSLDI